jgi:malic enzyme
MIKDADVFIGVSGRGGLLTTNMIKSMNNHPIIFALSNLDSEILR